jgi:hypothetical protein
MLYIISTNLQLLEEQREIFNNLYGFPTDSTFQYTNILKHYDENKWAICLYNHDKQYVLPSLVSSVTPIGVTPDWYPPLL